MHFDQKRQKKNGKQQQKLQDYIPKNTHLRLHCHCQKSQLRIMTRAVRKLRNTVLWRHVGQGPVLHNGVRGGGTRHAYVTQTDAL